MPLTGKTFLTMNGDVNLRSLLDDLSRFVGNASWVLYFLEGVPSKGGIFRGESRSKFIDVVNRSEHGEPLTMEEIRVLLTDFHIDWLKLAALSAAVPHPPIGEIEIQRGVVPDNVGIVLEIFDTSDMMVFIRSEVVLNEFKLKYPNNSKLSVDPECKPVWG